MTGKNSKQTEIENLYTELEPKIKAFIGMDPDNHGILMIPMAYEGEKIANVFLQHGSAHDIYTALRASNSGRDLLEKLTKLQLLEEYTEQEGGES